MDEKRRHTLYPVRMRQPSRILLNTADLEIWPAWLLRARSNHDARAISQARHVIRRKRDGRFVAAMGASGCVGLIPLWMREPGLAQAILAIATPRIATRLPKPLPLHALQTRLQGLGLDADDYTEQSGLDLVPEPAWLAHAGFDRYRRPLWLHPEAARAWARMQAAALRDGVVLEAISGYRSHDYQLGIFERKLARGLTVDEILTVNAAPGFSEHHGGHALDIGTQDEPPAEESFERTRAFDWLRGEAAGHGFTMSYPRDNPHGIVYEPWHWCWRQEH